MTRAAPENERFLSRWSRLKRAQAGAAERSDVGTTAPAQSVPELDPSGEVDPVAVPGAAAGATINERAKVGDLPLPAIDSLTMDSDYAQFFQPKVPESLRRAAVKKLFADPHFNIMDGLDTYIDDYTKSDPIPPEMLAKLWNLGDIIDHPSNRKAETVEADASTLSPVTDQTATGTESAIQEQTTSSDPSCRPREGGDPATFDPTRQLELEDATTADKSLWVPACAATTGVEESLPTDKPANPSA